MKRLSLLKAIAALIVIGLTSLTHAQVREIKMYADADATLFMDEPTTNGGAEVNNMIKHRFGDIIGIVNGEWVGWKNLSI